MISRFSSNALRISTLWVKMGTYVDIIGPMITSLEGYCGKVGGLNSTLFKSGIGRLLALHMIYKSPSLLAMY